MSPRRALGFESLEAKKSPTSALPVGAIAVDVSDHAQSVLAASFAPDTTQRLLEYVASLENVSVERCLPDQADVDAVDRIMVTASPDIL